MNLNLFAKHEKSFLEAKAQEWGWYDDNMKVFVGRMLSTSSDLTNVKLGEELNFRNRHGEFIPNKVADTWNDNIKPRLIEVGCPPGDWKRTQRWLQEEVFPGWVKLFAWQGLWYLTKPHSEIGVEIIRKPSEAGALPPDDYEPFQVPIGANVRYQIPMNKGEHLILLEKDGNHDIFCLRPSRHEKYKVGEPVAKSELIAIVSSDRPQVEWLETAASAKGFLAVNHQQIEGLMNWVNKAQNKCQLWQFEVEIVMPKIDKVVTVTF